MWLWTGQKRWPTREGKVLLGRENYKKEETGDFHIPQQALGGPRYYTQSTGTTGDTNQIMREDYTYIGLDTGLRRSLDSHTLFHKKGFSRDSPSSVFQRNI
jgi:hypothetical protein